MSAQALQSSSHYSEQKLKQSNDVTDKHTTWNSYVLAVTEWLRRVTSTCMWISSNINPASFFFTYRQKSISLNI